MKTEARLSALLACLLLTLGAPSAAEEHADLVRDAHAAARRKDAAAILQSARRLYGSLDWFSADGEAISRMKLMGADTTSSLAFSLRLGRPDRYLVSWGHQKTRVNGTQGAVDESGDEPEGAVWNAGAGPYNYARQFGAYARAQSDETARAMATGISQGVANTIPSLFFGGPGTAADIEAARLEGTEAIDGEECWVVSGPSRVSEKETVWISTRRLVVRQYRRSAKPPAGVQPMPDLSDERIDEGLGAAGIDKTPENRAQLKAMMEMAKAMTKHGGGIDGTLTETYRNIRLHGAPAAADFEFHVPSGTPLRASLLGGAAAPPEPEPPLRVIPQGEDARALLQRVLARYRALRSFSADGEIVSRHRVFGNEVTQRQGFSLRLGRPNLYRITWSDARRPAGPGDPTGGAADRAPDGALWNAGEGAFLYERMHATYAKAGDDRSALGVAAGVSAGLTRGVPPLFLQSEGRFTELTDPALEGTQAVQGEDCYVISASSREWAKHTLWISRERLLILQHRHVNRRPAARRQGEEAAFDELERRASPEAETAVGMAAAMEKAMAASEQAAPGDTTEVYRNIRVDEPSAPSEFAFKVPDGAVLKESLLEGISGLPARTSPSAAAPR